MSSIIEELFLKLVEKIGVGAAIGAISGATTGPAGIAIGAGAGAAGGAIKFGVGFVKEWRESKGKLKSFKRQVHANAKQLKYFIEEGNKPNRNLISAQIEEIVKASIKQLYLNIENASKILTSHSFPQEKLKMLESLESNKLLESLPALLVKMNNDIGQVFERNLDESVYSKFETTQIKVPKKKWIFHGHLEFPKIGNTFELDSRKLNIRSSEFFDAKEIEGASAVTLRANLLSNDLFSGLMRNYPIKFSLHHQDLNVELRRDKDFVDKAERFPLNFCYHGESIEKYIEPLIPSISSKMDMEIVTDNPTDPKEYIKRLANYVRNEFKWCVSNLLFKQNDVSQIFENENGPQISQYLDEFFDIKTKVLQNPGNNDTLDLVEKIFEGIKDFEETLVDRSGIECIERVRLYLAGSEDLLAFTFAVTDSNNCLIVDGDQQIKHFTCYFHKDDQIDAKKFSKGFILGDLADWHIAWRVLKGKNRDLLRLKNVEDSDMDALEDDFKDLYDEFTRKIELDDLSTWRKKFSDLDDDDAMGD